MLSDCSCQRLGSGAMMVDFGQTISVHLVHLLSSVIILAFFVFPACLSLIIYYTRA